MKLFSFALDFREVLKGRTQYQDVWIVHSPQYGNMLFLDSEESRFLEFNVVVLLSYSKGKRKNLPSKSGGDQKHIAVFNLRQSTGSVFTCLKETVSEVVVPFKTNRGGL